jgi:hypothetical protein
VTGILAHGFGGTNGLPLPRWLLGYVLAFGIVIAFVALRIVRPNPPAFPGHAGRARPLLRWRSVARIIPPSSSGRARALFVVARAVGLAVFGFVFVAAAFGVDDPSANIAPVTIIVIFFLGGQLAAFALGDWFWWFNPFDSIAVLLVRGDRDDRDGAAPIDAPAGTTSAVFLFAFVWFVFAYPEFYPPSPREVAWFIAAYTVAVVAGAGVWGRGWVRTGEGFGALFASIGTLAPWRRTRVSPSVALLVVYLGGIGFDGLSQTTWWIQVLGTTRGWDERVLNTIGLAWVTASIGVIFLAATAIAARVVDRPRQDVATRFAPMLVPIGLAWSIAHYVTAFLADWQYFIALLSDPLGRGWDLFGTVANSVNQRVLTPTQTGVVQTVVLFCGCGAAVLLAHDIAFTSYRGRAAVRATYPLAIAIMLAGVGAIALLLGT